MIVSKHDLDIVLCDQSYHVLIETSPIVTSQTKNSVLRFSVRQRLSADGAPPDILLCTVDMDVEALTALTQVAEDVVAASIA